MRSVPFDGPDAQEEEDLQKCVCMWLARISLFFSARRKIHVSFGYIQHFSARSGQRLLDTFYRELHKRIHIIYTYLLLYVFAKTLYIYYVKTVWNCVRSCVHANGENWEEKRFMVKHKCLCICVWRRKMCDAYVFGDYVYLPQTRHMTTTTTIKFNFVNRL